MIAGAVNVAPGKRRRYHFLMSTLVLWGTLAFLALAVDNWSVLVHAFLFGDTLRNVLRRGWGER